MKAVSLILLTIFLGKSCANEAQNDINNAALQYTAITRGNHLKIIINHQTATISRGRTPESVTSKQIKISDADWNELVNIFAKINLEELPNLKDPTQKRFYDGAAIATLIVRYQDKTYETVNFDHGFPPAKIEKLINKVVSLAKEDEE